MEAEEVTKEQPKNLSLEELQKLYPKETGEFLNDPLMKTYDKTTKDWMLKHNLQFLHYRRMEEK